MTDAYPPAQGWRNSVGFAGILIIATTVTLGGLGHSIGLALALIAFAGDRTAWRWLSRLPEFWVATLITVFVLFAAWRAGHLLPGTASEQWDQAGRWLKLLLFFPLAWFLRTRPRGLLWVAACFLLGLVLSSAAVAWEHWVNAAQWPLRFGGRLGKPIVFAFYCGIGILLVAGHFPGFWNALQRHNRRILAAAGAVLTLVFLGWAVLASGSRGPFFALLPALGVLGLCWLKWAPAPFRLNWRRGLLLALAMVTFLVVFKGQFEVLLGRFSAEQATIVAAASGADGAELPRDNTSIRLALWRFAAEQWAKRPLLGAGPGSLEHLENQTDNPFLFVNYPELPYDHVHNAYLQLLFSFGLVGVALALLMVALLARRIAIAWRAHAIDGAQLAAFIAGCVALALYSVTDFRHLNYDLRAFWWLSAAAVLSIGSRPISNVGQVRPPLPPEERQA